MTTEEIIELSVEETNKLRAELGLAPLRLNNNNNDNNNDRVVVKTEDGERSSSPLSSMKQPQPPGGQEEEEEEVLELSVDETNKLRAKLGLPPLRDASSSSRKVEDANLIDKQRKEEEAALEEREKLQDDVERGITTTFTAKPLGGADDDVDDVSAWAAKLRTTQAAEKVETTTTADSSNNKTAKKKKKKDKKKDKDALLQSYRTSSSNQYDEEDLKGIEVAHDMSELEAGSTTVMTLADAPLLQTNEHNRHIVTGLNDDANMAPQLENVALAEQAKQSDGLRKKRQMELGMGRAGGYAGFDDDEFIELGGTGVPSRANRHRSGDTDTGDAEEKNKTRRRRGFQIGSAGQDDEDGDASDLFAMESGKAISLEPSQADVQASDFLTEQEDLELRGKEKKKDKKKKDKLKKKKKDKKKHRRRQPLDDDVEESEEETTKLVGLGLKSSGKNKTLLEELEETAEESNSEKKSRKRSRDDDDVADGNKETGGLIQTDSNKPSKSSNGSNNNNNNGNENNKRAKYDFIMEKGNARTQQAFGEKKQKPVVDADGVLDEEPDDAFLNAALAKARRLKKLRDMRGADATSNAKGGGSGVAETIAEAVQSMPDATASNNNNNGITFSVDDTREFTRALQARSEQQTRKQSKAAAAAKNGAAANKITTIKVKQEPTVETVKKEDTTSNKNDDDVDMAELAKEIKDDDADTARNNSVSFLDGTTGSTMPVGRGLAGVLDLFKQTGDLTRKNAGKEELRGRAKDFRNYEDYQPLDLKSVVKINENYATDKDRELASREVKLEYRDKHGRLLTRKEAYRDLCYQFHGHGSSKRKEEKRQKQMAREQSEARVASQQLVGSDGGPGTFGALKATQKATGKAFVVHKT